MTAGLRVERSKPLSVRDALSAYGIVAMNGSAQMASALIFAVAARSMGVDAFGREAVLLGTAITTTALLDLGVNARVVRQIVGGHMPTAQAQQWAVGKTVTTSVVAAVACGATAWFMESPWASGVLAVLYGAALQHSQSQQGILRAHNRLWASVWLVATSKVIAAIAICWWAWVGLNPIGLWVCLLTGEIAAILLALKLLGRCVVLSVPLCPYRGGRSFAVTAFVTGIQSFDVVAAGLLGGQNVAGTYGAVSRWIAPLLLLPVSVGQIEAPRMVAAESNRDAWRIVRQGSILISPTLVAAATGIVLAPSIVSTVLGQGYRDSVLPLRLLLAGVAFGALGQLLVNFLQTRGQARQVARSFMATLAMQVGLVVVLTPRFGAIGVAAAMASSNAFASVLVYLRARKFSRQN